jgi:hypothetical protein
MSKLGRLLLAGLCSIGMVGVAHAESDLLNPRAIAVGEALRAAATGALAISLNPAGLALARSYVIEGSYGYRPEDHAHVEAVSLCDSVTSRVAACLSYNHLSADPAVGERSWHEAALTMAIPLGDSLSFGITNKYVSYSESMAETPPADNSHKGFLLDSGLTFKVIPSLAVAVVGYNLFGGDKAQYARALGGGMAFNVSSHILLAADGRYDFEHTSGRYGGGFEYLFSAAEGTQGIPIRAGYVYDSSNHGSYLTGGLGFITPRVGVDIGVRKQVSDGNEFMFQASLRVFFPN